MGTENRTCVSATVYALKSPKRATWTRQIHSVSLARFHADRYPENSLLAHTITSICLSTLLFHCLSADRRVLVHGRSPSFKEEDRVVASLALVLGQPFIMQHWSEAVPQIPFPAGQFSASSQSYFGVCTQNAVSRFSPIL